MLNLIMQQALNIPMRILEEQGAEKSTHASTFPPSVCVTFAKICWPNQLRWLNPESEEESPEKFMEKAVSTWKGEDLGHFFAN